MATWKFEYIADTSNMHDLFREVELRWVRVDKCEGVGSRCFVVLNDSGDYLETAIRAAMLTVGNLCPGSVLELRDVCREGDSYASFLITAVREGV